jgi:hypothetical protein
VPRKAFLSIVARRNPFEFTINPEGLALSGAKLPEVEDAETPRALFEERIALLRDLSTTVDALYQAFLGARASSGWEGQVNTMRKWITAAPAKPTVSIDLAHGARELAELANA